MSSVLSPLFLAAMVGTIAVTLVCVIFGAVNWNSGTEGDNK